MKTLIPWSGLTDNQKKQIKAFHDEQLEKKELFEHDLNKHRFMVNVTTGNIIFRKDF